MTVDKNLGYVYIIERQSPATLKYLYPPAAFSSSTIVGTTNALIGASTVLTVTGQGFSLTDTVKVVSSGGTCSSAAASGFSPSVISGVRNYGSQGLVNLSVSMSLAPGNYLLCVTSGVSVLVGTPAMPFSIC